MFRHLDLLNIRKGLKVFPDGPSFEYHFVTICLPAVLIALVVIALYVKERNKKL